MLQQKALTKERLSVCFTIFSEIIHLFDTSPEASNEFLDLSVAQLQDQLGKLRVWVGNIGGMRQGHGSLEYRLRDAPLVYNNVHKAIDSLVMDLREGGLDSTSIGRIRARRF